MGSLTHRSSRGNEAQSFWKFDKLEPRYLGCYALIHTPYSALYQPILEFLPFKSVLFPAPVCIYLTCCHTKVAGYSLHIMDAEVQMGRTTTIPANQPLADSFIRTRKKSPWLKQVVQALVAAGL